jgi:ArsR family transcriptional regulator
MSRSYLAQSQAKLRIFEKSNILMNVQNVLWAYKASVFQALAHPTRIAIIETLRAGEISAKAIQERLGIEQANLSQHLAILRSRQIVTNRKDGNQVFYSLKSPMLAEVLDIMRRHFQAHLAEAVQMLQEIDGESRSR